MLLLGLTSIPVSIGASVAGVVGAVVGGTVVGCVGVLVGMVPVGSGVVVGVSVGCVAGGLFTVVLFTVVFVTLGGLMVTTGFVTTGVVGLTPGRFTSTFKPEFGSRLASSSDVDELGAVTLVLVGEVLLLVGVPGFRFTFKPEGSRFALNPEADDELVPLVGDVVGDGSDTFASKPFEVFRFAFRLEELVDDVGVGTFTFKPVLLVVTLGVGTDGIKPLACAGVQVRTVTARVTAVAEKRIFLVISSVCGKCDV